MDPVLQPRHWTMIKMVKQIIDTDLKSHYTYTQLCERTGLNQHYLKYGFKRKYGQPLFTYLLNQRLKKSKELLLKSEIEIVQIALQVGYTFSTNFAVAFRRKYKVGPWEYRKQNRLLANPYSAVNLLEENPYRELPAFQMYLKKEHWEMIKKAKQILVHDLRCWYTIKELCSITGINERYLKYGFKQLYGKGVNEYLLNTKLDKAKEWLKDTTLQIDEIAHELGYIFPTNFTKRFKEKFKITPSGYREYFVKIAV